MMKNTDPRRIVHPSIVLGFALTLAFILAFLAWPQDEPGVIEAKKARKQTTKKARAAYFHRMLRDPETGQVPAGIRRLELAHAATMPKRTNGLNKSGAMPQFSWTEAGPNDVAGRTRAVAVDVNNSNIIIAGGVSGGIWKSTNGGSTWTLKSDPEDGAGITYIAQDRRTGNTNTWYATTGEFSGSNSDRGFRAFYYGQGILRSTDNGETWELFTPVGPNPTSFDSPYDYMSKVLVSPTTGTIFVASNGFGLTRTTGSLLSLSSVLGGGINTMWADFDIASNGTIVAVISDGFTSNNLADQPGVYTSTNDGLTWTEITPTSFPAAPDRSVIAVAPSNPDVAYMMTFTGNTSNANNAFGDTEEIFLYKFNLANGTSQDLTANLPDFGGQVGDVYTQRGYNMVIAVSPADENLVFIGGTNLYVSRDGFATRPNSSVASWVGGYATANNISQYSNQHPDQHALFFDPSSPNALWSAHDGGLSFVDDVSISGAFPWENKNNGYNVTQFYHVALPADAADDRLLGGTQDNGSPFFRYDPTTLIATTSDDVTSGDGAYAFLGDTYAIGSTQNGDISAYRYNTSGDLQFVADITPAGANNQLFINPFVTDPVDETIIYYPSGNSLWRRNAGGIANVQWSQLAALQLGAGMTYTALDAAESNGSSVLYLAASGDNVRPQIYRFENAGTSTSAPVDVSFTAAPSDGYVHSIAVNPVNTNEVLVAMSNYNVVGLYHTTNGGTSWTAVEGNLTGTAATPGPSIRAVDIVPLNTDTGYLVGTSTGFYATIALNGSNTSWLQESADAVGNAIVESIDSRTSDGRVALATHGRGIFVGMPLNPVANEDEAAVPALFDLDQNYPNPFNPSTNISFTLVQPSQVTLKVFDVTGKEVRTLLTGAAKASGAHQVSFDATGLPSGSYMYQLEAVSLASSETIHKESKVMVLTR